MKKSNLILGTLAMIFAFGMFNAQASTPKETKEMTLVEIASSNDQFSILVEAVVKAELVDALSAKGPYTVFAPTNEAFEALFANLGVKGVDDLTKDQLTPILLYHVVDGAVWSKDIKSGQVSTLNETVSLQVKAADNKVMVNKSNVVTADIEGSNGVIHVIDQVLVPATKTAMNTSGGCSK